MTGRPVEDDVLHRYVVAVATSTYDDPNFVPLKGVHDEVSTMLNWFADDRLGARKFIQQYPELAASPTRQQIRDALETPLPQHRWRQSDAAVLFVTGHGLPAHNSHWLALQGTRRDALRTTALKTSDLIGWLAETDIEHLLVVIDACYAGKAAGDTVQFDDDLKPTWLVLGSASKSEVATTGALTAAVQALLDHISTEEGRSYGEDPYLRVEFFIEDLNKRLGPDQRVIPFQGSQLQGPHLCLPNPHYIPDDASTTTASRHDLALPQADLEAHWGPRSRGVTDKNDPGWLFSGRSALMRRLISAATSAPGTLLVTGGAGSGKSAVLARLVTLSDPDFRAKYPNEIKLIDDDLLPPENAVDVAVLATGKNAPEIMGQICRAVGALPAVETRPTLVEAQQAWRQWIEDPRTPLTIVLDALDEASNPHDVLTNVLLQLQPENQPESQQARRVVRLIVGVRSTGGAYQEDVTSPSRRLLADDVQHRLQLDPHTDRVRVDEPPWWSPDDVVEYAASLLRAPADSAYPDHPDSTGQVAMAIGQAAATSFLVAKMAAEQLAARPDIVDPNDAAWLASINDGVLGVFRADLHQDLDADDRLRAVHLLRAVAFAYGRGLPWRNIWPLVANAVADEPGLYGDRDIAWLLAKTRLGGYLISDREDDITVYRLFHDDLRTTLRDRWNELLDDQT